MSPVSTATRSPGAKLSRVRSMSVVFPEPGELMKFKQSTPSFAKRARSSSAMRPFSFNTLRSNGTRSIFDLQIGKFQFISGNELRVHPAAGRTLRPFHRRRKNALAGPALMAPGTVFDINRQRLQIRLTHKGLETEAHRVRVHSGHLSDTHPHFANVAVRKSPRFRADRLQNRIGNSHLVHWKS